MVGIRRAEFRELSDMRLAVRTLERVYWQHYMGAFLFAFPECDPRAANRESPTWRRSEGRTYTDDELLTPPHLVTMREAIGTGKQGESGKIEVGKSPPAIPREPPRDTGGDSFDMAA
ncbi:hypothetical protein GCM10028862_16760 [Luteimonas pelagia]